MRGAVCRMGRDQTGRVEQRISESERDGRPGARRERDGAVRDDTATAHRDSELMLEITAHDRYITHRHVQFRWNGELVRGADTDLSEAAEDRAETVSPAGGGEDVPADADPAAGSSRQGRLLGFDTSRLFAVPAWLQGLVGGDEGDSSDDDLRRSQRRRIPLRRQGLPHPQGPFRRQGPARRRPPPPLRTAAAGGPTRRGPDPPGVVHGLQAPRPHLVGPHVPPPVRHSPRPAAPQEVHHVHHHTHVHVPRPQQGVLAVVPGGGPVPAPTPGHSQPPVRPVGVPRQPAVRPEGATADSPAGGAPWRWGGDHPAPGEVVFGPAEPAHPSQEPGVRPCNACGGAWIPCDDCDTPWSWQSPGGGLLPGPGRSPARPDSASAHVLFPGQSSPDELATEASVISNVIAQETPDRPVIFVTERPAGPAAVVTARVPDASEPPTTLSPVPPQVSEEPTRPSQLAPRPPLQPGSLVTESPARPNQVTTEAPATERGATVTPSPETELETERPRRRPTARPSAVQVPPGGAETPRLDHHHDNAANYNSVYNNNYNHHNNHNNYNNSTSNYNNSASNYTTRPPTTPPTTPTPRPLPTHSFTERLPGLDSIPIV
ncbi:hypothetical protein FJT64_020848 [Amphibalanus amphitrite]|uniref:Uncharacterized protein n=1 Tax=Amphibalanus amphitrite TaxID=1232801 RepID=A0A6A4X0C6_AMPAM|nr:hypothetical protein FJT64_020848 [Amphibalanus amphitrite]